MSTTSPASGAERTPWLDGWRGIAIVLVLTDHFFHTPTGSLGVGIFFVLSGLLMSRILFEQRMPLKQFYQRRIARTMPVFYLYWLLAVIWGVVMLPSLNWRDVAATAVFMRSYVGDHIWDDPLGFGHIWSLNVEEHAYLILALLALFTQPNSERKARWLVTALCCIPPLFVAYYRFFPLVGGTQSELRTECAIFPLVTSAAMYLWIKAYSIRISPLGFMLLLTFMLLVMYGVNIGLPYGGNIIGELVLPLSMAATLNFLHCSPEWVRKLLSARWLTWFGMCSYSLYLWNYPFFRTVLHGNWPFSAFANISALLCSIAVSAASFYWFEQPIRAWLSNLRKRDRNVVAVSPQPADQPAA